MAIRTVNRALDLTATILDMLGWKRQNPCAAAHYHDTCALRARTQIGYRHHRRAHAKWSAICKAWCENSGEN